MKRFPWILTLLVVPLFVFLIGLGVWQMQRLQWKTGLIATAEAVADEPPRPLADVLAGPDPEFRRVIARCTGLAKAPYVELTTIVEGASAVRLISACKVEGQREVPVLVDRGVVAETISARPPVDPGDRTVVEITGVLRHGGATGWLVPDRELSEAAPLFYARDAEAMAPELGVDDISPLFLIADTSSNPEWLALRPMPLAVAFSNNHLGYAITWFGLAIVLVGFYVAMLRRRLKKDLN